MRHDTTIIGKNGTQRTNGTAVDAAGVAGSEGIPESANVRIRRKAMALLELAIVAGLAAASVGFEATVAQAVETQTKNADGDGTRGGNRNHNRSREAGDSTDGDRSSKRQPQPPARHRRERRADRIGRQVDWMYVQGA